MPHTVTIVAAIPEPTDGRQWLATALLEAPDLEGSPGAFTAIEAAEGALSEMQSRHAEHANGWYRLQWFDDGNVSKFSNPVRAGGPRRRRLGGS